MTEPGSLLPGPLMHLGGGRVLLGGPALADVVRALEAAQHVTRANGYGPPPRWRWLLEQLRTAARESAVTAPAEQLPQEVPHTAAAPPSSTSQWIGTREAASVLGCGERNVRDLALRGVLETARRERGRLLLDLDEVQAEAHRRARRQAHRPTKGRTG